MQQRTVISGSLLVDHEALTVIGDQHDSCNAQRLSSRTPTPNTEHRTLNTGEHSLMCHPDPPVVIVVNDSDQEDCGGSQSDTSIISLVDDISTILSTAKASGSTGSATSRHGKSKLMSCSSNLAPTTDTGIRRRPTKSQLRDVIVIDCDESSHKPPPKRARSGNDLVTPWPVKSDGGARNGGLDTENKPRSKRAKIQVDLVSPGPPSVESNGSGAQHQVIDQENVERLTRTTKVVHGSAVELGHVPNRIRKRKNFIWVTARRDKNSSFLPVRKKQNHLRVNPPIALELSPVTAFFWLAGGAINRIIQKPGCIAISSATLGGQPDDPEVVARPLDSYNRAGTLQIWKDGNSKDQSTILHGHCVIDSPRASEGLEQCRKCYTVNDISFDPNRNHLMASTGNNGAVQLWQDGEKLDNGCYEYPRAPHDVTYRERDSLLAVTCMNGCVYVHPTLSHDPLGDPMELRVGPPEAQHSVGAIVWGKDASADTLFASSESQSITDYSGYHVAFDPDQGRRTYEFSAKESGDAMALDPDGARLALCTASHDGAHFLRLYDIRRKDGQRPLQKISLDTFFAGSSSGFPQLESRDGEVRAVSFSPDGLLLAVSRSDDELHIYDSRFMGRSREPMRRFLHWGDDCCLGGDRWGIVDAVWVDGWCGKGLGVITGGSDGCVRFWDVRRSADDISNGEVLARPDSDIGHFSVGDPYSGEKPLVIGDNGGRVYVYDHATAGSSIY